MNNCYHQLFEDPNLARKRLLSILEFMMDDVLLDLDQWLENDEN